MIPYKLRDEDRRTKTEFPPGSTVIVQLENKTLRGEVWGHVTTEKGRDGKTRTAPVVVVDVGDYTLDCHPATLTIVSQAKNLEKTLATAGV